MANPSYKWLVVAMLWLVCFFNYADRQAIFSVFPVLKSEMGLSDLQLGLVASSFMWVYAIMAPAAGLVADRFNRKTLILGGLIFWSAVTAATALSTNYWHLVICRALEGLGEAFYFPASMSLVSSYHDPTTRSRAMGMHQSSVYAGTIAGGTVAGIMAQAYGWRSSFYLFGGLGLLLGILLLVFLKEPPREAAPQTAVAGSIKQVFAHPMVPVLIAVFVGANFVAMIFLSWMPSFLGRKFGMSLAMAGFTGTAYLQAASMLGAIAGGWLADRLILKQRGGRMIAQAIGLLCGVPFIFITGWTLWVPGLILAMSAFGFFKGIYDANIWASLHDVVAPNQRATAVGLMNSVGWVGGSIAPLAIAAASARWSMSASISANALVYLLVGLLMLWGVRRFMQNASTPTPTPPG